MAWRFAGSYLFGLITVGVLLASLYAVLRMLARARVLTSFDTRLITVVETAFLAQNALLQIVRIGGQYYALSNASGRLALLCELPEPEMRTWLDATAGAQHSRDARST